MRHLPRDIGEQIAFRPAQGLTLAALARRLFRWIARTAPSQ